MNKIFLPFILLCGVALSSVFAQDPFILGADVSWIPQREAGNVKYADNGQVKDILTILKEHDFNYIRLRLFVDPTAKITGESESPYSTAGYCGLNSTLAMAKRVKAAGFKLLLDFHYSDTWADPAKQYKPVSWANLTTVADLATKVRSYTKETLELFKDEGVLPDMVQVGNEVVGGMIWPEGRNSNWANFGTLMNAGIDGVKDVDENILIMAHTINERKPYDWLTSLKNTGRVTRLDVIGLSYYSEWHGQPDSLQRVVDSIAKIDPEIKISVVEYADNHRRVNDIIFNLPNKRGIGTFVWEPADWREVLFDWKNGRRETNERIDLYPQMAIDYAYSSPSSSSRPSSSSTAPSSSSRPSSSSVAPSSSSLLSSSSITPSSSSVELSSNSLCDGTEKFWNFSDTEFTSVLPASNENNNITESYTIDGLTIVHGNGDMGYTTNAKEIDGYSFTHRFQLMGTGSITNRALEFDVTGTCNITVYAQSGNSTATRALVLSNSTSTRGLQTIEFPGDAIAAEIYTYTGDAETLYLYSNNSGINIYGVKIKYCDSDITPNLKQISVSQNSMAAIGNGLNVQTANSAVLEIYNLHGKPVRKINLATGNYNVSLADLPQGIYIARLNGKSLMFPVKH